MTRPELGSTVGFVAAIHQGHQESKHQTVQDTNRKIATSFYFSCTDSTNHKKHKNHIKLEIEKDEITYHNGAAIV